MSIAGASGMFWLVIFLFRVHVSESFAGTDTCAFDQFTCSNMECRPESVVCDGNDDCGDNSDEEQDCGAGDTGLAVGLSVGLSVPIILSFIICVYLHVGCYARTKYSARQATSEVSSGTTTQGTSFIDTQNETYNTQPTHTFQEQPNQTYHPTAPVPHFIGAPYPTQFSAIPQAPYSIQPQHEYKDAQFSSGEAPPSYDAAVAYPSLEVYPPPKMEAGYQEPSAPPLPESHS